MINPDFLKPPAPPVGQPQVNVQAMVYPTDDPEILIMETPAVGQVQLGSTADGKLVFTVNFVIPANLFKFQKTGGLVGANGQPMLDVQQGIASAPMGKILIKRSGLSAEGERLVDQALAQLAAAMEISAPVAE